MLRYLKYFRFSLNLIRKSLVKVALRVTIATMIMMVVMMMMMILGCVRRQFFPRFGLSHVIFIALQAVNQKFLSQSQAPIDRSNNALDLRFVTAHKYFECQT